MKIRGTCLSCGRDFFVEQVIASGGKCPWDGRPFQPDYAAVLVDALRDAENAGSTLENSLEKVADMNPTFVLHPKSVLDRQREHLERLERSHGNR